MADVNGQLEPDYAKMDREWRDSMRRVLPESQCGKLTWAIWNYYLDQKEPRLPKPAMLVFETMRDSLDCRRRKSIEMLARKRGGGTPSIAGDSRELCETSTKDLKETCEVSAEDLKETSELYDRNLEDESSSTCEYEESTSQCLGGQREVYSHSQSHNHTVTKTGLGMGSCLDEGGRTRAPTLDAVRGYCEQCGLVVYPENFFNFFEANGWRDGKGSPIRNWRAVLRAWNKREGHYPEKRQPADVGNGGNGRKRLEIGLITGSDKQSGEWFIKSPVEYAGPIPGSKELSWDEAIRLAIELHPDLNDATGE